MGTVAQTPSEASAFLARLGPQARVLANLERPQLALELAVAREALGRERAVGDRAEGALERLFVGPELELPHAGRVDQKRPGRKRDELAMGRRVAPAAVGADLGREKQLAPGEAVDERGLADTGRSEQRDRPAGDKMRLE